MPKSLQRTRTHLPSLDENAPRSSFRGGGRRSRTPTWSAPDQKAYADPAAGGERLHRAIPGEARRPAPPPSGGPGPLRVGFTTPLGSPEVNQSRATLPTRASRRLLALRPSFQRVADEPWLLGTTPPRRASSEESPLNARRDRPRRQPLPCWSLDLAVNAVRGPAVGAHRNSRFLLIESRV